MGISRYNAEGYHDPTAHLAVCHVEEGEKIPRCLRQKEQKYQTHIQTFSSRALKESKKEERQYWGARMKEARRLLRRTQGNLELLREVAGYE